MSVNAADVVTVQHLVKRYGHMLAVNDVSFSIHEGEIFGIIGPNGAGKTTCVECISGLRTPDAGTISVYGSSPQKDRNRIRAVVGVQLQESALPPRLKVGEAVRLFASFYANPLDPDELLKSLGLTKFENSAFKNLSGGQKQRLSIALALVGNPKLAILDELTTGLDPEARRETWSLIERMRDRGVTVILVTHFMDEAEKLCDRLALINHGTVRALDMPEAIAAQAGGAGSDSSHRNRLTSRPCARYPACRTSSGSSGTSLSSVRAISRLLSSLRWARLEFAYQMWRHVLGTLRMPSSS